MEKKNFEDLSVLYVEDDELISTTFGEFLKRRFGEVYMASDGRQGLEAYKAHNPDIVITDISMPEVDGLEMSQSIKEIDKDAQIIITTAYSSEDLFIKAIDIGVASYVIKPIERESLLKAIESASQVVRLQKELKEKSQEIDLILNFQKDMVIVTDGKAIKASNKSFLDFFGKQNLNELNGALNLDDVFLMEEGFIYSSEATAWIDMLRSDEPSQKKVRIKDEDGSIKTFMLKYNVAEEDESLYVISFSDITDIEMEIFKIQKEADTDKLTGIFNRNRFDKLLERELHHVQVSGKHTSLLIFDIDRFKDVNDTLGHIVGDEVLKGLARAVYKNIRVNDIFARWGGEEFVVMAPDTKLEDALLFASKLREEIEKHVFAEDLRITCSFGVTELVHSDTVVSALERVDQALYAAKQNGRNRVEFTKELVH